MKNLLWLGVFSALFPEQALYADDQPTVRLDFDVVVTAQPPKNKSCPPTVTSKTVPRQDSDVCAPDPAAPICSMLSKDDLNKDKEFKKGYQSLFFASLKSLSDEALGNAAKKAPELKQDFDAAIESSGYDSKPKSAAQTIAMQRKLADHPAYTKFARLWKQEFQKLSPKILDRMGMSKIEFVVKNLVETFNETLDHSLILDADEKNILKKNVSSCAANIKLSTIQDRETFLKNMQPDPFMDELNAAAHSDYSNSRLDDPDRLRKGQKVNLLSDDPPKCELVLSADTWMHCLSEDETCSQLLLHELGHFVNSCDFVAKASIADRSKQKADNGYGNPNTRETRSELFGKQRKAAMLMAHQLIDSTECLERLSSPKMGVPNACSIKFGQHLEDREVEDEIIDRCNSKPIGTPDSILPSQWSEAEADFWGASAFASHLEKKFPQKEERAKAFTNQLKSWCANAANTIGVAVWRNRFEADADIRKKEGQPALPVPDFNNAPVPKRYERFAVETFLQGEPYPEISYDEAKRKKGCLYSPDPKKWKKRAKKNGRLQLWEDEHQSWGVRFNRNYLRNTELRHALGCKLSQEVPYSCSPLGTSSSVLVQ